MCHTSHTHSTVDVYSYISLWRENSIIRSKQYYAYFLLYSDNNVFSKHKIISNITIIAS